MENKTALQVLNEIEANGELLDTETAIRCMEEYSAQQNKQLREAFEKLLGLYIPDGSKYAITSIEGIDLIQKDIIEGRNKWLKEAGLIE